MTSRERMECAFSERQPDRFPVMHIGFSSDAASRLLGREAYVGGGVQQYREACALWEGEAAHRAFLERSLRDALDIGILLKHDMIRYAYWRLPIKPAGRLDGESFVYGEGRHAQIRRYAAQTELFEPVVSGEPLPLGEQADRALARCEDPIDAKKYYADYLKARAVVGEDTPLRVNAAGLSIPTQTDWLEAVALEPEVVAALLDAQTERGLREIHALHELGVPYVFGGGDMASAQGPMYSPRAFEKLMLPRLRRLVDACNRYGMKYLFNSDGNLWPVADMIFLEAGAHGYYEIDADAGMDLKRLRAQYPQVTLFGNISSALLYRGTPAQVAEATRACCELARDLGRIVVGCSNQVVIGTKNENMAAMFDTIRQMTPA